MKKYFAPLFLQKIDKYLFEKYPVIWETNIHYFIFYAIIINLMLMVMGFLIPISQKGVVRFEYNTFELYLLLYIPILIFASFRIVKNLKFSLYQTFLRFLMCVLIAFLWDFTLKIVPNVIYWRVSMIYDKKQVEEDAFYIVKTRLLSDFIQKIYFLSEREEYLSILRKSYFNQHNEIDEILNQIRSNETKIDSIKKYGNGWNGLTKTPDNHLDKIIKNYPPILLSHLYNHSNNTYAEKLKNIDENNLFNIAEHLYLFEQSSFIWMYNFTDIQNKILFGKVYPYFLKDKKGKIKKENSEEYRKHRQINYFEEFRKPFCKQQDEKVHKMNLVLVEKMLDAKRLKKILFEEPDKHKGSMRLADRLKLIVLAYWFLFPIFLLLGRSIRMIKLTHIFGISIILFIFFLALIQVSDTILPQEYFNFLIFYDILLFFMIYFHNYICFEKVGDPI